MQLNGQFLNDANAIQDYDVYLNRAVDTTDISNPILTDTSYKVDLGRHYISGGLFFTGVKIKVDISQWFKNPNTIDLHILNSNLTGNYDAQIQLAENNETVFTFLGIETD